MKAALALRGINWPRRVLSLSMDPQREASTMRKFLDGTIIAAAAGFIAILVYPPPSITRSSGYMSSRL